MNTEEFINSLNELLKKVSEKETGFNFYHKVDRADEADGKLFILIRFKNKENKKAKEYKLPMYIFEGRKHLTTAIISSRTFKILFENSSMDSPNIGLHYLETILDKELTWVKNLEEEIKKQHEAAAKKRSAKVNKGGKKPYQNKGGKFKGNNSQSGAKKPYQKPSGKGASKKFGNNNNRPNNFKMYVLLTKVREGIINHGSVKVRRIFRKSCG